MKIDIQSIDFEPAEDLLAEVRSVLGKFIDYDARITGADVYLKTLNARDTNTKKMELKLYLPGNNLYAEHVAGSMYEALHEVTEKMRTQLVKRKDMLQQKR